MSARLYLAVATLVLGGCTCGGERACPPTDGLSSPALASRSPSDSPGGNALGEHRTVESSAHLPVSYILDADSLQSESVEAPLPEPVSSPATLAEMIELATAESPAIAGQLARIEALQGRWLQAGTSPNPTVGYSAEEIGDDGTAGKQGAFLHQSLVPLQKRCLDQEIVAGQLAREQQALAILERRIRTDVQLGYYQLLVAERKLDLARELLSVSEQAVETSTRLLAAMEIARVGLLQTEVEAENARVFVAQAHNEWTAARRGLALLLGQPEMNFRTVTSELDEPDQPLDWSVELARLLDESPEVAEAVANVERADAALRRAYAEAAPTLEVEVQLHYDNASGDTVSGVQIGLPVPLKKNNVGSIQAAHAELIAATHRLEGIQLQLTNRLATAFRRYADARVRVRSIVDKTMPKARETFEVMTQGFERGEVGYLDLLFAQRTFFQTNLTYLEALDALWGERIRIEGLLLDDHLATIASND